MQNRTFYFTATLLALLTAVECQYMGSAGRGGDQTIPSIISFVVSIAICTLALFKVEKLPESPKAGLIVRIVLALFCVWLIGDTVYYSKSILSGTPVDYRIADPLPIMEIMSQRFLKGEDVYAIIPEIWGGMLPIYLPAMWLPYTVSTFFHFDPRWVDITMILAATIIPMLLLRKDRNYSWFTLLIIPAIIALYQQFVHIDRRLISMSDEGVVIGWYVLLACALWSRKPVLIGISIALSVLARLTIIGWIPAFGLFVFFFEDRKKAFKIAGVSAVVALFLMFITGAIFNLSNFLDLPKRYLQAVMGDEYQKLLGAIHEGPGVAKMLTQQQLPILHVVNQWATFLIPMILLALYWRFKKYFDHDLYPIVMLKISLVFFFNLLIIPVHELIFTSTFLSLAIFLFYTQSLKMRPVEPGNNQTA